MEGFLWEYLAGLRELICGKPGKKAKRTTDDSLPHENSYPYAVATAVASWIMHSLGVSSPVALGLATLILIKLAKTTKNAFCKMTDAEVLASIFRD